MKRMLPTAAFLGCAMILLGAMAALADDAPARPAPPATRPGLLDPVKMVQNVRRGMDSIDLSDDQKGKVAAILDKADQDARDLQQKIQNLLPREKLQQVAAFVKDLRQQLTDVLNPEQAKELGEKLRPGAGGGGAGGAGGGGGAGIVKAAEESLAKLDLSADQRKQVQDLLQQLRQKAQDLREKAANGESIQDDLQQIRQDVRQKIGAILTPEQLDQFQELMQQAKKPADTAKPDDGKANKPAETMKPDDGMKEKPAGAAGSPVAAKPVEKSKEKDLSEVVGPDVGAAGPDVKIQEADGRSVPLSSFKGHVTVIVLGSLSCPTFRDRAADIEKLKTEMGSRAFFVLIYTREAHPSGEKQIDRNKQDAVDIEQPADLDARKKVADRAVKTLHITMPVTVDDMDDSLAKTLGGFPNGCIVVGKDGTIVGRLRWAEPGVMKRMIDEGNK